jgi:hypothetical protein
MLIATLYILLFGGGSDGIWLFPDSFSEHVEAVVSQEERQDELNKLFDQITKSIKTHDDNVNDIAKDLHKAIQNPNTTDQELNQYIKKLLKERTDAQTKILDARFKMAEKLNPQEWKDIFLADAASK